MQFVGFIQKRVNLLQEFLPRRFKLRGHSEGFQATNHSRDSIPLLPSSCALEATGALVRSVLCRRNPLSLACYRQGSVPTVEGRVFPQPVVLELLRSPSDFEGY